MLSKSSSMSKVKAGFSKDVIFEMRLKGFSREYRDGGGRCKREEIWGYMYMYS